MTNSALAPVATLIGVFTDVTACECGDSSCYFCNVKLDALIENAREIEMEEWYERNHCLECGMAWREAYATGHCNECGVCPGDEHIVWCTR